jgi:YD repeat-containing protein
MYYSYDTYGNIRESRPAGSNTPTVYLWGYKHQYPIAKIENATYEQVISALGYSNDSQVETLANKNEPTASDWTTINNLRTNTNLSRAQVTTYTYKPLIGIQTVTDSRGVKTTYEYDSFGRLQKTILNNSTIEDYQYHYKN